MQHYVSLFYWNNIKKSCEFLPWSFTLDEVRLAQSCLQWQKPLWSVSSLKSSCSPNFNRKVLYGLSCTSYSTRWWIGYGVGWYHEWSTWTAEIVKGTINSDHYIETMKNYMLPSVHRLPSENFTYQQHNAPLVMSIFLNFSIDFDWNRLKEQKSMVKRSIIEKSIFTTSRPPPVLFFWFFNMTWNYNHRKEKIYIFYCNPNFTPC